MKNYDPGEIIQIAEKLVSCQYALQMFQRIRRELGIRTGWKPTAEELGNHWDVQRLMFYQDSFFSNFADVMSFFHKQDEKDIFDVLSMTPQDRKSLYELRGVISHVVDYEKLKAAWLATLYNPSAPGIVEEFIKVRDHFFKWFYKVDKRGASVYQEKFKSIDSHFGDNQKG